MEIATIVSAATALGPLVKDLFSAIADRKDKKTIDKLEKELIEKLDAYSKSIQNEMCGLVRHIKVLYGIVVILIIAVVFLLWKTI